MRARALLLLCLLPFLPGLLRPDLAWLSRDLLLVNLPAKTFWAESLRQTGHIPAWNPHVYAGTPFWAEANLAVLNPLNVIFLLFPAAAAPAALKFFLAAHYLLLTAGAAYFFRLYVSPFAAVALALAFCWSGVVISAHSLTGVLAGATAAVWTLGFWVRWERHRRPRFLVGASVALAGTMLGGDPQFAYLFFLVMGLRALAARGRGLGPLFCVAIAAAGLAAAQILPTLSFLGYSSRSAAYLVEGNLLRLSLHPARLIEVLLPGFFGSFAGAGDYWGAALVNGFSRPFFFSIFLGPAALLFLAGAFVGLRSARRRAWLLPFACLTGVALSFGIFGPIPLYAAAMKLVPGWKLFRFPERLWIWVTLGLFAWVARELPAMGRRLETFPRETRRTAMGLTAVFLVISLATAFFAPRASAAHAGRVAALECVVVLACFFLPRARWGEGIGAVALMSLAFQAHALLWAEPVVLLRPAAHPHIAELARRQAAVDTASGEPFRFAELPLRPPPPAVAASRSLDPEGAQAWAYVDALAPNLGGLFGFYDVGGYATLYAKEKDEIATFAPNRERLLDLFAAPYRLAQKPGLAAALLPLPRGVAPYFFLPQTVELRADLPTALARALEPTFPLRQRVVMEASAPLSPVRAGLSVRLERREPDRLFFRLRQELPGAGDFFFAVNESFDPYWRAVLDGKSYAPLRQNGWALGFVLPRASVAGTRALTLEYANPWIPRGVTVSLAAAMALFFLVILDLYGVMPCVAEAALRRPGFSRFFGKSSGN